MCISVVPRGQTNYIYSHCFHVQFYLLFVRITNTTAFLPLYGKDMELMDKNSVNILSKKDVIKHVYYDPLVLFTF